MGVPACSGLFYQEKSSNEDILGGELFYSENNIAHPSEKCKPFFEKQEKRKIYKNAGKDAHIRCRTAGGTQQLRKNAIRQVHTCKIGGTPV